MQAFSGLRIWGVEIRGLEPRDRFITSVRAALAPIAQLKFGSSVQLRCKLCFWLPQEECELKITLL